MTILGDVEGENKKKLNYQFCDTMEVDFFLNRSLRV